MVGGVGSPPRVDRFELNKQRLSSYWIRLLGMTQYDCVFFVKGGEQTATFNLSCSHMNHLNKNK